MLIEHNYQNTDTKILVIEIDKSVLLFLYNCIPLQILMLGHNSMEIWQ